jgi:UTP-glucose-1-phosphate uridylyltransferase
MTSLVILAAGLGTRFGGHKQLAEFGKQQLTLMEYNLINAVVAGFTHVVFVINPKLESQLRQQVIKRLPKNIDYSMVYQSLDDIPQGSDYPQQRIKPLGTAHALWCCRNLLKNGFAVINADDFYGKKAFSLLLEKAREKPDEYLMVAYKLQNTLSDFGGVNRGLCVLNEQNYLTSIDECEQIRVEKDGISGVLSNNQQLKKLSAELLVSMNCWFFTIDIFIALERALISMLKPDKEGVIDLYKECYLPAVVMQQIQKKK